MDTVIDDSGQRSYWHDYVQLKNTLRPSIDKLRSAQFREGSSYSDLRNLLPLPVLGLVWFELIHGSVHSFSTLLGLSITVRHLLLALGIAAIWNVC